MKGRDDRRRRIGIDGDAVLAHALIVLVQPGRQGEPQFSFGLAAGGVHRLPQIRIQAVVDGLTYARDRKRQRISDFGEIGQVFPKLATGAPVA